jgi:hypothetical protein
MLGGNSGRSGIRVLASEYGIEAWIVVLLFQQVDGVLLESAYASSSCDEL